MYNIRPYDSKKRVPVFLGSSFAYIAPVLAVVEMVASEGGTEGFAYARGGMFVTGSMYLVVATLVYFFGVKKIVSFFPPIVIGPIILVIGLKLAPTTIDMASGNWLLAVVAVTTVIFIRTRKRFFTSNSCINRIDCWLHSCYNYRKCRFFTNSRSFMGWIT